MKIFSDNKDENASSNVVIIKSMDNTTTLKQSLETVYLKNRQGLLARAKKATRNILDAEDVLHEAFVGALSNLNMLARIENIPAWLFTVIRNRIIDLWRRKRTVRAAGETDVAQETIAEIVASTGLDPSDEFVRGELLEALSEAIAALPDSQREVIEAQVIYGTTFKELADHTGVSVNTLMTRKKLAIKKLSVALHSWIAD